MEMNYTELLFLRLTLANVYDQQDWERVRDVCMQIDALSIDKAQMALKELEESVS